MLRQEAESIGDFEVSPPPSPFKMPFRVIIIVISIIIVLGVVTTYLIMRSSEIYDLSYDFKPGESYVYNITYRVDSDLPGFPISTSSRETLTILEFLDNRFKIRNSAITQVSVLSQKLTSTTIMKYEMDRKGSITGVEIDYIEPRELQEYIRNNLEELEGYWRTIQAYPKDPIPIGHEWTMPVNLKLQEAYLPITLVGTCTSSITSRESISVKAGTFDCLRLSHKISASGEVTIMNQKVTISISGEGTSWIDLKKCFQIRVDLPLSIKVKATGQEVELRVNMTIELIEYKTP
ncbi:MAG: hypothetical protein QXS51_05545 [Thermoproteota archaeon]